MTANLIMWKCETFKLSTLRFPDLKVQKLPPLPFGQLRLRWEGSTLDSAEHIRVTTMNRKDAMINTRAINLGSNATTFNL